MNSPNTQTGSADRALTTTKLIEASPDSLFDIWTSPAHVQKWWGPDGVDCPFAEIDLRVGGSYRIANRLEDATVIWISGEFQEIDRPHRLVYSWRTGNTGDTPERVTVEFDEKDGKTEVTVTHELIVDEATLQSHENGWGGCLNGLARYVAGLG